MQKLVILILSLFIVAPATFAHDEGHGPKMGKERPKYGGKLANMVEMKKDNGKTKLDATPILKAELAKVGRNELRLFVYDNEMNPIELSAVTEVKAFVETKDRKTRKWKREANFDLTTSGRYLTGTIPGKPRRPFNVEVELMHAGKPLLAHFSHIH